MADKGLTLLVATASLAISALTYLSNAEGLNVDIRRDLAAAIDEVEPTGLALDLAKVRLDAALQTTWNVSIINTSLTATIPITGIRIDSIAAFGGGESSDSDGLKVWGAIGLRDQSGHDVALPIGIKPGEVMKFTLLAKTSVSRLAYPDEKPGSLPAPAHVGEYYELIAKDNLDPFGNITGGFAGPGELEVISDAPVREPCVRVQFVSGRQNKFDGFGYWYRRIYRKNETRLTPIDPPVCWKKPFWQWAVDNYGAGGADRGTASKAAHQGERSPG